MNEITLIGVDLVKTIFRINAIDANGRRVMNKNIHRESVIRFFATLPECTVAWRRAHHHTTGVVRIFGTYCQAYSSSVCQAVSAWRQK